MKAIAVLGTASNAGKSWLATALCAWLRQQGVKVAPFKAQNMSNNAFATLEGGEMGRAQAVQAEACGLRPVAAMNPILLKPCGGGQSQLILNGQATETLRARDYYQQFDRLWETVQTSLAEWRDRCEVLVLEGAGSPVELNLLHRDLVNLRPVEYLDGRWLLVGDIEHGGIFAQIVGTWTLMSAAARQRGLGFVVNKFRGDLSLFAEADQHFQAHLSLPYLGTLPYQAALQPESEDSLCRSAEETPLVDGEPDGDPIAWIRLPHLANSQDCQPWRLDRGVSLRWVSTPAELAGARVVVLPGSKNTLRDLHWLKTTGLAAALAQVAASGGSIVGICGGYQMLGQSIADPAGLAGDAGEAAGLGLLPIATTYEAQKIVRPVLARWPGSPASESPWLAYEIHAGHTQLVAGSLGIECNSLLSVATVDGSSEATAPSAWREEGCRVGNVWGTYVHGLFESTAVRSALARQVAIGSYQAGDRPWHLAKQDLYAAMAEQLDKHLNLDSIREYLCL